MNSINDAINDKINLIKLAVGIYSVKHLCISLTDTMHFSTSKVARNASEARECRKYAIFPWKKYGLLKLGYV